MKNSIDLFKNNLLKKQVFNELLQCNEFTSEYGLKLSEEDVKEIINTRNIALQKSGRIEFNGQIINKIITAFCDSPYISQYNYGDTINELVEIFYNYKNETLDYISDDELIEIMQNKFNNYCQGSLELLEGKVLYKIADNIRNGVKDYINCGKDLKSLNISSLDRTYIKNKLEKLSLEELQKELLKCAELCCETLYIKDKVLISYIEKTTLKAASLINQAIKLNKLETVFLSFNEDNEDETISYTDGEKMENSEFKKLSEEIRECSLVEDKIGLIKNNIKSLEDLVDMLSADCLFGEEYIMYFKSLSQMEIVLLDKYMEELGFENEWEKEWYSEFNKYILVLSEKERALIKELKEKMQF